MSLIVVLIALATLSRKPCVMFPGMGYFMTGIHPIIIMPVNVTHSHFPLHLDDIT